MHDEEHDYFNHLTENLSGCTRCGAPIEVTGTGFGFTLINNETALMVLVTADGARLTALENNPFITDTTSPRVMGMPVVAHMDIPWDSLYASLTQAQYAQN